jgi:hypothetical protein
MGTGARGDLSTKRGHIDLSVDIELGSDWVRPALISLGVLLVVGLIYQLLVGGIRIEATGGRFIVDASGLVYWWHLVSHH